MSRSNKPRTGGSHSYVCSGQTFKRFLKKYHNSRLRQKVRQQLKDVLFTDAYDEKELLGRRKEQRFDLWIWM